jgi:mersacidin/lichenicidin family type 2 lantibiotic
MKFDIARAWKDETYRQSLSAAQLSTLPANPAGELSDADLAEVSGGIGGFGDGLSGLGGFSGALSNRRNESVAVICEINVFSINVSVANILASTTQICVKG